MIDSREIAEDVILAHGTEPDRLTVVEAIAYGPGDLGGIPAAEVDTLADEIERLIRSASVTITFDEETGPCPE